MPLIDPLYVTSGFAVGVLVGMTGVGGGSLMTPLLILLFGIHPSTAVGTDLLYAAGTKAGGSVVHMRPLPSDSNTATVPVSAAAKFAPLTATGTVRNFSRR